MHFTALTVKFHRTASISAFLAMLCFSHSAWAVGMGVFGVDAESNGLGDALAGYATGASASYYNPAGLVYGETSTLKIGCWNQIQDVSLSVRGTNPYLASADPYYAGRNQSMVTKASQMPDSAAHEFGLSLVFGRVAFGMDTFIPQHSLLDEKFILLQQPYFLDFSNAPEHASAVLGLSGKILDNLSVGASSSVVLSVTGGIPVRIPLVLGSAPLTNNSEGETSLNMRIHPAFGWIYGAMWEPLPELKIGAVYRSEISINARLHANLDATILGSEISVPIELSSVNHYEPAEFVLGGSYAFRKVTVMAEGSYNQWSTYIPPYAKIAIPNPYQVLPPFFPYAANAHLRDTVNLGVGAEWKVARHWLARAGYRYKENPVPPQTGNTNIIDGDQHYFSVGGGYRPWAFLQVDAMTQYQVMMASSATKNLDQLINDNPSSPGYSTYNPLFPGYVARANFWNFGATVTYRFGVKMLEGGE